MTLDRLGSTPAGGGFRKSLKGLIEAGKFVWFENRMTVVIFALLTVAVLYPGISHHIAAMLRAN